MPKKRELVISIIRFLQTETLVVKNYVMTLVVKKKLSAEEYLLGWINVQTIAQAKYETWGMTALDTFLCV